MPPSNRRYPSHPAPSPPATARPKIHTRRCHAHSPLPGSASTAASTLNPPPPPMRCHCTHQPPVTLRATSSACLEPPESHSDRVCRGGSVPLPQKPANDNAGRAPGPPPSHTFRTFPTFPHTLLSGVGGPCPQSNFGNFGSFVCTLPHFPHFPYFPGWVSRALKVNIGNFGSFVCTLVTPVTCEYLVPPCSLSALSALSAHSKVGGRRM